MPSTALRCPKCSVTLRVSARPPEGKKIKCPKCEAVFVASEHEIDSEATAVKTSPPAAPATNARPSRKPTDEIDDEDDDTPRRRKSRRERGEDDELDDRPRKRKARRRQDDDEDDDDDRLARRGGKKATSSVAVMAIAGVAGLVCMVGGFFLVQFLMSGPAPADNPVLVAKGDNPPVNAVPNGNPGQGKAPFANNPNQNQTPRKKAGPPRTFPGPKKNPVPNTTPKINPAPGIVPKNPNTFNPGVGNPGIGNPGIGNPGNGNPGVGNPGNNPNKKEPPPVKEQPPIEPDPVPEPVPVAGPVDLDETLLKKTSRATAMIRVSHDSRTSTGSGFLVKSGGGTGYFITNYHVIADEPEEPKQAPPPNNGVRKGPKGGPPGIGRPPTFRPPTFRPPMFRPPSLPGFPSGGPGGKKKGANTPAKPSRVITVVLYSGTPEEQSLSAEVVAVDQENDLAALRVTGARNLPDAIDATAEAPLTETQPVYTFGFPANRAQARPGNSPVTVGKATIAGLRRDTQNELIDVHLNGNLSPGSSGGPVIDAKGRLVGVAVAAVPGKQIGFAIPAVELRNMFKGKLFFAVVFQVKRQGVNLKLVGETWVHGRNESVRGRKVIELPLAGQTNLKLPPNEYIIFAALSDPMLKIRAVNCLVTRAGKLPTEPGQAGWTMLPNSLQLPLKIQDQNAIGVFTLPPNMSPDENFAFQFSYINDAGRPIFTQPHPVRLTFPENPLSVTLNITNIPDDTTRRYLEESADERFAADVKVKKKTADSLELEIDPVEDPKTILPKLTFGKIVQVQGRSITVQAKKIALPMPTEAEIEAALADIASTDRDKRIGAANRLANCYAPLPARRADVARVLDGLVLEPDIWIIKPALRGLVIWGSADNIPSIIKSMKNGFVVTEGLSALAGYDRPEVATEVARFLTDVRNRGTAAKMLKSMRQHAENAVLPYVAHKDFFTACEACRVLEVVGTRQCIPALTAATNSNNGFTKQAAAKALKILQAKLN